MCRSPSHAALPVGTKALQERLQTAPPAFHIEQFITSQRLHLQKCPAELTQKSRNPFWKFGIWKLDQQQSYGEHTVPEPLLGDPTAHWERMGVTTWGSVLGSQRAVPEGWNWQLAPCLHCHGPAETRTQDVTELTFCLQEPGGKVKSKHNQNKC